MFFLTQWSIIQLYENIESSSDIFKRQQKTYLRKLLAEWRGEQSR